MLAASKLNVPYLRWSRMLERFSFTFSFKQSNPESGKYAQAKLKPSVWYAYF